MSNLNVTELKVLKENAKQKYESISGVKGFGIGKQALRVYISQESVDSVKKKLPATFKGVKLELVITDSIEA